MTAKQAILDTNLLVLLVVGSTDLRYVARRKRLKRFKADDYHLLRECLAVFERIVVSPHILAETSNLLRSGGLSEPARTDVLVRFREWIDAVNEHHVPAIELTALPCFDRLGIADTGIVRLSGGESLVVTVDGDLYLSMRQRGFPAINFNHLIDLEG